MRFRWNSYWHNWSRILGTGPRGGQCEVCCTPVNGWRIEEQVERVRAVNVREHFTRPDPRDKIVDSLPPDVVAEMRAYLGDEAVNLILHPDLADMVDWEKASKLSNGGTPLDRCRKEG